MAFQIYIGIKVKSQDRSKKVSNVEFSVTATWSGGTWNHEAPTSALTIDGTSYNYNAKLNPNRTTSGSQTLFKKTLNIAHNSDGTKKLTVIATYAWRNARASVVYDLPSLGTSGDRADESKMPVITEIGLQKGTDRTTYVVWTWTKDKTKNYRVVWYYDTGNGVWFVGNDSTSEYKHSTYSAPSNAKRVRVKVKPLSETKTVNNKQTDYWTAEWSEYGYYNFSANPLAAPSAPTVELTDNILTAELENISLFENVSSADKDKCQIQFQVIKDNKSVFANGTADVTTDYASYQFEVVPDSKYKVRCRAILGDVKGEWSEYSGNVNSMPSPPSAITVCRANSSTSVYLEWTPVNGITTYDIEYTTKKEYFDGSDQTTVVSNIEFTHYEKTGLETGKEYFFRVRAVDENIRSDWSEIKSVIIGKKPAAPTTWSYTTVASLGDTLKLYWVHNAEDGSKQRSAQVELRVGDTVTTHTIIYQVSDNEDEEEERTSEYTVDTSIYTGDTKLQWRIRTAGVTFVDDGVDTEYSDWSVQRTIDIYTKPTLEFGVTNSDGEFISTVESYPFYIGAVPGPVTQKPIGYQLSITANETYETVDYIGNDKIVNAGDTVFSKYYDIYEPLLVELLASDVNLENNVTYTVTCVVYMDSGLTAEASLDFDVAWVEIIRVPDAEIGIDPDTFTAHIRPYCADMYDVLLENVVLSVYRREFDGGFTKIATGIENERRTYVTDPHPALDYARYRIIAMHTETGAMSYYDPPGYPVGGEAVIIQWDEIWSDFNDVSEDRLEQPSWAGSFLKLPYNIDISDKNAVDVSLIEYIGRKHPVSYYGTQVGSSSTWNVVVPKDDEETLYALRRLALWMGDAYVREPSGSGYWAHVSVSFSQKHCETTVPVTLEITRVEGGM